jgi:imidazole glycerol-phosphate synthase subunit HisH
MIAVLDYGIGNLRSAEKALQHVGADAALVTDPDVAAQADAVVLPGVGAFGACASALRQSGLDEVVRHAVMRKVPLLAICIGFQLLFEGSDEDPGADGLGILAGQVRGLPATERLPQMQWNIVRSVMGRASRLLGNSSPAGPDSGGDSWFYFVHSYAPVPEAGAETGVVGVCDYGGPVVAAMEIGSVFATQFHPEKSGHNGLELLRRFASVCGEPTQ